MTTKTTKLPYKGFDAGWRVYQHYFITPENLQFPFYFGVDKFIPYCANPKLKNKRWVEMVEEAEKQGWKWKMNIIKEFGISYKDCQDAKQLKEELSKECNEQGYKLANLYKGQYSYKADGDLIVSMLNRNIDKKDELKRELAKLGGE